MKHKDTGDEGGSKRPYERIPVTYLIGNKTAWKLEGKYTYRKHGLQEKELAIANTLLGPNQKSHRSIEDTTIEEEC